jgi:hypothetical protein
LSLKFAATSLSDSSTPRWLYFSVDGFGPPQNGSLFTSIEGATYGTVNDWSYIAPSNRLFDTSAENLLTVGGPLTGLSFSNGTDGGLLSSEGFYSPTEIIKITNPGAGQNASGVFQLVDPVTSVADGGATALLVGLGLVGLSMFARRRKVAKAQPHSGTSLFEAAQAHRLYSSSLLPSC